MNKSFLRAGLASLLFASPVLHAAPFGYAADGDSGSDATLYQVDLANFSVSPVGPMVSSDTVESLSFGPGDVLFGVDEGRQILITIDTSTAAVTDVGPLGISSQDPGLAYCTDNTTMYLASEGGELYTVDTDTGTATLVGSGEYGPTALVCMSDGTLYSVEDDEGGSLFYSVDRTDGTATLIGNLGLPTEDGGMSRWGSQIIFAPDANDEGETSPSNIYSINPATGVATLLAELDPGDLSVEGFAISPLAPPPGPPKPVPTLPLPLLGALVAVLGLVGRRYLHR